MKYHDPVGFKRLRRGSVPVAVSPTPTPKPPISTRRRFTRRPAGRRELPYALLQSPLADQVPVRELRSMHNLGTLVDVPAETQVITQGSRGNQFLVVVNGVLSVQRDGRALATLSRGDFAGELSLIRGERCNASVETAVDSSLLALNRQEFDSLLATCPGLASVVREAMPSRLAPAA